MCGRVIVKTNIAGLLRSFSFAGRREADGLDELPLRFNGSPGLYYPLIIYEDDVGGPVFTSAKWGFVPRWMKDPTGGHKPINAKSESISSNGMFRHAYRSRRALMPIDGFFEWKANTGSKIKQPYAIAMKSGEPFCLAAIWETWRHPDGSDITTFAVVTCAPNEMMAEIHNRMPVILHPDDYTRWISGIEDDPYDLMKPFPSELMTMWPISTKVNVPRNNTADILDPIP